MPSKHYLIKLVEKARQYLPDWLFKDLMYYARASAGGVARHRKRSVHKSQPGVGDVHHERVVGIMKPYERQEDLPGPVKRLPPRKRRQWMKAFNEAYRNAPDGRDPEEYAFRVAWAAVSKSASFSVVKADDEKRLVYGVVYVPNEPDSQGDITTEEEIEKAAHSFLINVAHGAGFVDVEHSDQPARAYVVESFIAPVDFRYPGSPRTVKKGSWVAVTYVEDEALWELVKNELGGYSMAGTGKRVSLLT